MPDHHALGFIGSGRMAQAMIKGLLDRAIVTPDRIHCTSAADGTGEATAKRFGIHFTPDLETLVAASDILILAIKPQQLTELPPDLGATAKGRLLLSILAGTPLRRLRETFSQARNLVRAMPNTPGQIGFGVTAYASAEPLGGEDRASTENILGALGRLLPVEEDRLDAVTGLSGSGPAYVFEFVAALREGGIAAGLDPQTAYTLALETTRGAAELLRAVPESPEQHRDWVTSPGGTTLAGLKALSEGGFRALLHDAVMAATARSRELAGS